MFEDLSGRSPAQLTPAGFLCSSGSALPALAAYWFAAPTPTFDLSTWPLPSSHRKLPELPRIASLLNFTSLSKSTFVPGSPHHKPFRRRLWRKSASHEVCRPFSASRRKRLPTVALPQPLGSALVVSHDLDGLLRFHPPRSLPRVTLLGFLFSRAIPQSRGLSRF